MFLKLQPAATAEAGSRSARMDSPAFWGHWWVAGCCVIWAASFVIGFVAALAILFYAGMLAVILGLKWPGLGLIGIGIVCTLNSIAGPFILDGSGLLRWNTFNYWLLAVMLLYGPFLLRLNDLQSRLLQLFVLLLGIEIVVGPDVSLGVQHVLGVGTLFGLLVYLARTVEDKASWLWMGMTSGLVAALGGLAFYLQKDSLEYINPNVWSYFPLTGIFALCLGFPFVIQRGWRQLAFALLAVLNTFWIFLSGSRGDLLIGLCCILYIVLAMRGVMVRVVVVIGGVVLATILTLQFAALQDHSIDRLRLLINPVATARVSTSGRSNLALGGWYIFLANPLGVGTGGFSNAYATLDYYEGVSDFYRGEARPAHAAWIKTLSENGIPGFLLMAAYVGSFAVSGLRRQQWQIKLLGVMTTMALSATFLETEFQDRGTWMLAAGTTVLLHEAQIVAHLRAAARRERIDNILRSGEPT